jgi:hypothetical protein
MAGLIWSSSCDVPDHFSRGRSALLELSVICVRREFPQDMGNMPLVNATILGREYQGSDTSIVGTSLSAPQPIGPSGLLSIKVALTTKQSKHHQNIILSLFCSHLTACGISSPFVKIIYILM